MSLDEHIRLYDPAIDWSDGATPIEWAVSRDPRALRLRAGKTPIVFHCARLSRRVYAWITESPSESERLFRAFRAGVRRVQRPDGAWTPQGADALGYVAMTDDEADVYGIADQQEIGGLIIERSLLPFDCAGGYTLRPSSLLVRAAALRASLSAGQSQGQPPGTASEPAASSGV